MQELSHTSYGRFEVEGEIVNVREGDFMSCHNVGEGGGIPYLPMIDLISRQTDPPFLLPRGLF